MVQADSKQPPPREGEQRNPRWAAWWRRECRLIPQHRPWVPGDSYCALQRWPNTHQPFNNDHEETFTHNECFLSLIHRIIGYPELEETLKRH